MSFLHKARQILLIMSASTVLQWAKVCQGWGAKEQAVVRDTENSRQASAKDIEQVKFHLPNKQHFFDSSLN